MSTINTNYFNYTSSMFSSFSVNSSNGSNASSSLLGDYMSIRNGSYKKLLTAYYAKQKAEGKENSSSTEKQNDTQKALLSTAKTDATALKNAADKLTSRSLYTKVTKTTKDETTGETTTTTDYDRDAITKAVKAFAESYNKTLDSAAEQDNLTILRKAAYMTKSTAANRGNLSEIGVTVGQDNKLTVDEEKLKKADIYMVKSLFEGSYSYAGNASKRAGDIASMAEQLIKNASKSNASTYTSSGKYSAASTGDLYDAAF
ncbi:MAG: flagellar filament capping protein FliD [Lachnospiraceae bacterium]|nr:flagellar filament capping protein FliD [Lachnospiraceae bacterium]